MGEMVGLLFMHAHSGRHVGCCVAGAQNAGNPSALQDSTTHRNHGLRHTQKWSVAQCNTQLVGFTLIFYRQTHTFPNRSIFRACRSGPLPSARRWSNSSPPASACRCRAPRCCRSPSWTLLTWASSRTSWRAACRRRAHALVHNLIDGGALVCRCVQNELPAAGAAAVVVHGVGCR